MKNQSKTQNARNAAFEKTHQKILDALEAYITDGWTQTLANLLVYMGEERANETLEKTPADLRKKIAAQYQSLKTKKRTDTNIINATDFVLKNSGLDGETLAKDATENLSQAQTREILLACKKMYKNDPILTISIENFTLTIKDICAMSDLDTQRFLRRVDVHKLAIAITDETDVQQKIFKNVSSRAATMIQEDIEFCGALLNSREVEKAKKEVLKAMKKLAIAGCITIDGKMNVAGNI